MAIDNKYFFGGLNSDDEDRVIQQGDYRFALNIRNSKSDSDSQGSVENVKGNLEVTFSLGTATYKCVGGYDDTRNNKVYYFVWAADFNHKLLEYDVTSNTIETVCEGDFLNLDENRLILEQNITVLNGIIYWLNVKPYRLNIERAKTGGYPNPIPEKYIEAIVEAPNRPPTCVFGDDPDRTINDVRHRLFQFRTKFIYEDNEESAWSPISKVALPIDEAAYKPSSYYPTTINNKIDVQFDLGDAMVKRVKLAVREGDGDFVLVEDINKEKLQLTSGLHTYTFYNDEVYTSIDNDGGKGLRLFDNVPLEANAQSLIDGNKIAYAGITEGFDPVDIDIDVEQVYTDLPRVDPPSHEEPISEQLSTGGNSPMYYCFGDNVETTPNNSDSYIPVNYWATAGGNYYKLRKVWRYEPSTGGGLSFEQSYPYSSGINGEYGFGTPVNYISFEQGPALRMLSNAHVKEFVVGDNNGEGGVRYIYKLHVRYFDYFLGRYKDKDFTIQYTSQDGDGHYQVAQGICQEIAAISYQEDNGLRIYTTWENGTVKPEDWSIGLAENTISTGKGYVIRFNIRAEYISDDFGNLLNQGWDFWTVAINSPFPAIYHSTGVLDIYANWTSIVEKTLKSGANHGIGIVYYDNPNRSGLTNIISNEKTFYVPFQTERGIGEGKITDDVDLRVTINHQAPDWAKYYQIVYTGNQSIERIPTDSGYQGFIYAKLGALNTNSGVTTAKLDSLSTYNDGVAEVSGLVYGFTKGDRIRFVNDEDGEYLQEYVDVEVLGFDEGAEEIKFKAPPSSLSLTSGYIVEIYTPKKKQDELFYYEVGEVYEVNNGLHLGNEQDQTVTDPAILYLDDIGDVYLRYRIDPFDVQVESYSYSDFYRSNYWDKGRPNIVDNNIKRIYRPTTIRYSNSFIPETNINGLSRFDDFDFEAYDQKYGDIMLLYSEDKGLNIFQKDKVGQVGVNQSTLYSNDGSQVGTVKNEVKVLSDIRYYSGEYGIGNHPESFAVYGNAKYFADVKRGAVLRLGGDGLTPISNYKMHNHFNDTFNLVNKNDNLKLLGVYDVRFGEYILSIYGEDSNIEYRTIAFSEDKNRWETFYSYEPEFMVGMGIDLVTFKDGVFYKHNANPTLYNNFYNLQYNSNIDFLSNVEPNKIKVFDYITQDSTDVWYMPSATNQYGQSTSLITEDFADVEGVFKTSFLRDENTPNVSNPLIEGDSMRSHSMLIKLENANTDFVKLFSVGVGVHLSELTNR